MPTLADITQVTITSNSRGVSRRSFGIPLVLGSFTYNDGAKVKTFNSGTSLTDLVSASSVVVGDHTYKELQALVAQNPKPRKVLVGALPDDTVDQVFDLEVVSSDDGDYTVTLQRGTQAVRTFTHTASSETPTQIATALAALIDADPEVTSAAAAAGVITVTMATAGNLGQYHTPTYNSAQIEYTEATAIGNLATEYAAVQAIDDSFYSVHVGRPLSGAGYVTFAGVIETQEKILAVTSFDSEDTAVSSGGTAGLLAAQNLLRTHAWHTQDHTNRTAAAASGVGLARDPGSLTWAFKGLSSTTTDEFSATAEQALDADNTNRYVEVGGLPITYAGKMAGGEWIDVVRGRDWLVVRLRERIFGLLANAPKVPYTQAGIDAIALQVSAQLREGIGVGYLSPDPLPGLDVPFVVTTPEINDVSTADKNARILRNVAFQARLAGAIHQVVIEGVIQV